MKAEEIKSLLVPFLAPDSLSPEQIGQIQLYLDLLLKWNSKVNLTAIRSEKEIVTRHFGESLFAARQFANAAPSAASVADIGSGAGFPGLPINIWTPRMELTLVESNHKKASFLREVVRALNLAKVEVLAIRAEELRSKFELVTLRAVEHFESILPVAGNLLQNDGSLALLIGETQIAVAKRILQNLAWSEAVPIPCSRQRVLLIGEKND